MSIELRPAQGEDFRAAYRFLSDAIDWLDSKRIRQWLPQEFDEDDIASWQQEGDLWMAHDDREIVGSVLLQSSDELFWPGRIDAATYVHKLVIDRRRSGTGTGRAILDACERRAAEQAAAFVRLDTCSDNPTLVQYYLDAAYVLVNEITVNSRTRNPELAAQFPTWRAALFEKRL